jgi:hypothetical protein
MRKSHSRRRNSPERQSKNCDRAASGVIILIQVPEKDPIEREINPMTVVRHHPMTGDNFLKEFLCGRQVK